MSDAGKATASCDVIGLKVTGDTVRIEDLCDWIACRDAACAEYLLPALRQYLETREDVQE